MDIITVFFNAVGDFTRIIFDIIRGISFIDIIDILIVALVIYGVILLIRDSRAVQLIKGVIFLIFVYFAAILLHLELVDSILSYFFQFALVAVMIVFQPEIRKALESIGRNNIGRTIKQFLVGGSNNEEDKETLSTIIQVGSAVERLQYMRMGALIIFERKTLLGDIAENGTIVDANVTSPLIENIFFNKASLHDGAMIIRDNRIYSAGCILPLSSNNLISVSLGTRHRAALGMSEQSDAVVLVVSEETGDVRLAVNGQFEECGSIAALKEKLSDYLIEKNDNDSDSDGYEKNNPFAGLVSKIRGSGK